MEHPRIQRRSVDSNILNGLIATGMHPLLAKVIAGRPIPEHPRGVAGIHQGKLADLNSPFLMKDMSLAVARLIKAILNKEVIAIETDHDCDGQTSHAVMIHALRDILGHPKDKILSFIGHRMQEGYGLSDLLCDRILKANPLPSLVVTADNGSSDEPRIERLKNAGIDVIVTDHHAIPVEGIPKSAYAVLNPTREDCEFPDPYIAGCMVAWLLMAATRRKMIEEGHLPQNAPAMTELLDFVAVGTIADCVSLARSLNNRVVVQYGLTKINEFKRSCWQALRPLLKNNKGQVNAEDLGFLIGPLLNSDGRLSDALGSVNFLLTENIDEALPLAQLLFQQNEERKRIQKELTREAEQIAEKQTLAGKVSLVIHLEDGHAGVHGISASRIKDLFGRPTVIFSPKLDEPEILTGSCRSIDGVHIRDVLQAIHNEHETLIIKFGGHKAAAGLSIRLEDLDLFVEAFERSVADSLNHQMVGPLIWTDGLWEGGNNPKLIAELYTLQPFGREFDEPIFELQGIAESVRCFGQNLNHLEIMLKTKSGERIKGIWFFACDAGEIPVNEGENLQVVFSFAKRDRFEVYIKYAKPLS